jgi:hypothetical protein
MNGIKIENDGEVEIPKWDIALEALAREEYEKRGRPLTLEDLSQLAAEYSIRFDDILVTMFELVIHEEWCYRGMDGVHQPIVRETLDRLYVGGRLRAEDVRDYTGAWQPKI